MQNNQLTSQSRAVVTPITLYKKGVNFTIKTPSNEYEIDGDTAQKLTDELLTNSAKFIKVKTTQGQVLLNASSIMSVAVDDTLARDTQKRLEREIANIIESKQLSRDQVVKDNEEVRDYLYDAVNRDGLLKSRGFVNRDLFDYLFDLELAK